MSRNPRWLSGFYAGVCSALACVEMQDGANSTLYNEIVMACGARALARWATKHEGEPQAGYIRKAVRDTNPLYKARERMR